MSRDLADREYAVARAVWLYQRWVRVLARRADGRYDPRATALSHRLTRWLTFADASERAMYYQAICALSTSETTCARISRRRGRQVVAMAVASREADAEFDQEDDDAEN